MFRVRPDAIEATEKLLSSYDPPQPQIDDNTRLVSTSVFMKDGLVVRMIEFEGDFARVMAHLSRDPSIQAVERQLDGYLVEEDKRDMSTPAGAREFFSRAMMKTVTTRVPKNYTPAAAR